MLPGARVRLQAARPRPPAGGHISAHPFATMMGDNTLVLPTAQYVRTVDTPASRCAECLGICGAGIVMVAVLISPLCFAASGAVFLVNEYENIPDCAHPYKAWCIVISVLMALSAVQSKSKGLDLEHVAEWPGGAFFLAAGLVITPAAVGYTQVVQKVPGSCPLQPMHQLVTWTWFVLGYYTVFAGLLVLASFVRCCELCKQV